MFVGYYGVFAAKSEKNKIPLWVLLVAVQLLDFLWVPFVLLGIENVRIVPGFTATESARSLSHAVEFAMKIGLLVIGIVLYLKQMDHDQRLV
jgi:hypothetical protein